VSTRKHSVAGARDPPLEFEERLERLERPEISVATRSRPAARELGLTLDDLWSGSAAGATYPRLVGGKELPVSTTKPVMDRVNAAATETARRIGLLIAGGALDVAAISCPSPTPAAVDVDREKLGVPVPTSLSRLPH
jgi:hypothetical protein